ncbi:uncharacterized protein LOC126334040 [Schistocerca gregaria]|uniref:uncharacterized protein LOC126334040 n=1 Tax=Schistocerca gregaria TaxID=7010 RepID=UPI00211EF727|nr:uncharacterized protein LOC126334040 [Schistocerca gregaria]
MRAINNLLILVVVQYILLIVSLEPEYPSKNFVVRLNKLFIYDKQRISENDYCGDSRIFCDKDDRISEVLLEHAHLSKFPSFITMINDTLSKFTYRGLKGEIPSQIYELTELRLLRLIDGDCPVNLSDNIGKLLHLKYLNLGNLGMRGKVPNSLYSLTGLTYLGLEGNNFTGFLSDDIQRLAYLWMLNLGRSGLSGPIPNGLYTLTLLASIDLSDNSFNGSLSNSIEGMSGLYRIRLSNSGLSGSIPDRLYSLKRLRYLDLSNNGISGVLSPNIDGLVDVVEMNLSYNRLGGPIPKGIAKLTRLRTLLLQGNRFEGDIPNFSSMRNLVHMEITSTRPLNAKCDDGVLPPNISRNECLIGPVSVLCNNVTRCRYTDGSTGKSSVGSMLHTYRLKMIAVVLVCIGGIEIMLD